MARASVLADSLRRLLRARGWEAEAERFFVRAVEPALEPIDHAWLAGEPTRITDEEVRRLRPSRIIVPDETPSLQFARMERLLDEYGRARHVYHQTRFIDQLWGAGYATQRALVDAQAQEPIFGDLESGPSPEERHVPRELVISGETVRDHRLFERTLSSASSSLAILSDAGLGKSELLQWMEWRYAVRYESAVSQRNPYLPPVALRVPLRTLRSMAFESIAQYLAAPDPATGASGLTTLSSGTFLIELVRMGRIILLLDGVDELQVTTERLDHDLRELARTVADGGRIVLTARKGHLATDSGLRSFYPQSVASVTPMTSQASHELLMKNSASEKVADTILRVVGGTAADGNPLYLLLALWSNVNDSHFSGAARDSKTKMLKILVERFCARDEERLGVPTAVQLDLLKQLSHWLFIHPDLTVATAMELLGCDPSDAEASILSSPHAFVTLTDAKVGTDADAQVSFKYPEFHALFLAMALAEDWETLGFRSVEQDFRTRRLMDPVMEFLARIVTTEWFPPRGILQ